MSEITLMKLPGNLFQPATPEDAKKCERFRTGDCMTLKYSKKRNGQFFRKWHSLVQYAFDVWESPEEMELNGRMVSVEKNYDRFRKDVTMRAGYYHFVTTIAGDLRAEADSIAWGSMDEDTFIDLYDATVSALLKWVLKNYTRQDVDNVMRNIAEYA